MSRLSEDPRLPYAVAALLGMIAGVAAKQAVAISTGNYPKPISILADILVLGMVFVITMYILSWKPDMPVEGLALISAALAMWGPRGIAALLNIFKAKAIGVASGIANTQPLDPVDTVRRPTVVDKKETPEEDGSETIYAKKSPIRKLRDKIPLEEQIPADQAELLGKVDRAMNRSRKKAKGGNDE
jgi:hypothetical protein